jgi:hypothetical protein
VVRSQHAVIVTLGISENALRVRLAGPLGTAMGVRSRGTRNVITAMRQHGVGKLVVQTSYGVGTTRRKLPPLPRLFFWLVLRPQIADTERQERAVRASGLDWVIAQPVTLTSRASGTPGKTSAIRSDDGRFMTVSAAAMMKLGLLVVARLHDVGKAQCDERYPRPLRDVPGDRLAPNLRQRVGHRGHRVMFLIHRGIPRREPRGFQERHLLRGHPEGEPQGRLARRPHDPAQPQARRSMEDVEVHRHVGGERDRWSADARRRNVGQVNHGLRRSASYGSLSHSAIDCGACGVYPCR